MLNFEFFQEEPTTHSTFSICFKEATEKWDFFYSILTSIIFKNDNTSMGFDK